VIVHEVEIELKSQKKLASRVAPNLRKALSTGTIQILDATSLSIVGVSAPVAVATLSTIQQLGAQYHTHVDYGEAYTHAAALTLGMPAMSHDISALQALINNNFAVPTTVLRYFDLVVAAYQGGYLSEPECDNIRQKLFSQGEWVPRAFTNASFATGLSAFDPRLIDSARPAIGRAVSAPSAFATVIHI
jgi:hypothetical protein